MHAIFAVNGHMEVLAAAVCSAPLCTVQVCVSAERDL